MPVCLVAAFPLPKGLVGAHLRVDCLPSGSFAGKLVAGVGVGWIAPPPQWEAVVIIVHYCASEAIEDTSFGPPPDITSARYQDIIQVKKEG